MPRLEDLVTDLEFLRRNGSSIDSLSAQELAGALASNMADEAAMHARFAPLFVVDAPTGVAATDTAALNDRITECIAAGGGVVQARAGTYAINGVVDVSTLTAGVNVDLRGMGIWATVFRCDHASAQVRFSDDPPVATGMRGSLSGDFTVDGNATAANPMFIGHMAEREFSRIRVTDAATGGAGLTLSGTQNCLISKLEVSDCANHGLLITNGAGGNIILGPEISANGGYNVKFTLTADGSYPYGGIPTDNKIIGGLIERLHASGTDAHLYYGGGSSNRIIGTRITVGAASMPLILIRADDGANPPDGLRLIGVDIAGSANGIGIDSNVNATTTLVDCTFFSLAEAFRLGDTSLVEIDAYHAVSVTTRFANQAGGTNTEENLIRQRTTHPREFTGSAADKYGLLGIVSGDSVPRFGMTASGSLEWGPGTGARDVGLGRGTTNRLDLAAGDSFRADVVEVNGSAGAGYLQFNNEQSSAPAAPSAGRARLFIRDDGAATELAMRTDSETVALVSASMLAADFGLGHKAVRKSADETLNNNATMQDDNELLLALGANETWVGRVVAFLDGSQVADFKVDLTVPAGATITYGAHHARAADTVMVSTGIATAGDVDLTAINAVTVLKVEFSVANGSTAGNLNFRWAQNAATAADSTVKAGSYIEAHRIA